jgi:signal transduction histidine kinase
MLDTLNILMVEDSPLDAELTLAELAGGEVVCSATRVETEAEFRDRLQSMPVDLILSDFSLPQFSGLLALNITRQLRPDLPFIFVSGALGEDTAVEMLREGATDYVLKHRLSRLVPAVKRAVLEARERSERRLAEERLRLERQRVIDQQEALLASERRARNEAERASRMKDEFLATLSHELRTPLNAILGWSQILAGGHCEPEDLVEGLATIERNARAQTRIIEELLDMSRITSGKLRLEMQDLNLWPIVHASIETVKTAASAKSLALETAPYPGDSIVRGDPDRLQQVFINLLTNAVKFTPREGRVRVSLLHDGQQVRVRVTDTGEGISPAFLPFVFDRFRQADASITRRHGGLGLGLAIVKQLV